MKKTFQFRIYPNKNQEVLLNRTLGTCRRLYNDALAERKRQAELNRLEKSFEVFPWGKSEWIDYYEQKLDLTANKTSFQKEVYSQVLQDVIKRVDRSFKNFFRGFGYPRFQGRNRYNSFTYPQYLNNKGKNHIFDIIDNKLKLPKLGLIKIILHRPIPSEAKIKTCTIKKDINQWYVSFSCDIDIPTPIIEPKTSIGIDVGLTSLLTLSNGTKILPPKFLRLSEKRLWREQQKLSKKKLRSKNRNKQKYKLSKIHRTIRNQRKDFNHKLSRILVNTFDSIAFEDLQIQNMLKNHSLSKSISDASWYQLQQFTLYKAEYAGKSCNFCNPRNTSQTCSICGNIQHLTLKDRTFKCSNTNCHNIIDRDHNAAINILNRCNKSNINMVGTIKIQACSRTPIMESMTQEAPII